MSSKNPILIRKQETDPLKSILNTKIVQISIQKILNKVFRLERRTFFLIRSFTIGNCLHRFYFSSMVKKNKQTNKYSDSHTVPYNFQYNEHRKPLVNQEKRGEKKKKIRKFHARLIHSGSETKLTIYLPNGTLQQ